MPITYEKIDDDEQPMEAVAAMMKKYHGELVDAGVSIECLWARNSEPGGAAVKLHGYACYAVIKVVSLVDRALGCADARIKIDEAQWEALHADQRNALIDHELEHLLLVRDKKTNLIKHDDLGRPRLRMKLHDWQLGGFVSVARRHKDAALEVHHVVEFVTSEDGQMVMEFKKKG